MADRAMLFKMSSKQLGTRHGLMPSFMAKPHPNLPGTSGHIHVSLVDQKTGKNVFARDEPDQDAEWDDLKNLSDLGRYLYKAPGLSELTTAWLGF
jgi:glutamine synthetase